MAVSLLVGGLIAGGARVAQAEPGAEDPSYSVSGQVTNKMSGKPVAGIRVSVDGGLGVFDTTDADGRYVVEVSGAGGYYLFFKDPHRQYVVTSLASTIQVDGHERYDIALVLGGKVKARVLSRTGPLEQVTLDLYHRDGTGKWVEDSSPYPATTSAAGRVTLPEVTPGTYRVGIDPSTASGNHAPMFWGGSSTIGGSLRVKVRPGATTRLSAALLKTGSVIYGAVTRPDGTPVRNARVDTRDLTGPVAKPSFPTTYRRSVRTDAAGAFRIDSLAAHPHKVCAIDNLVTACLGGGSDLSTSTTVTLDRAEKREVRLVVPYPGPR